MSKFNVETKARADQPIPVKQWTALDELTHDFMNSAEFRARCLQQHGQYMTRDGRRITHVDP